ncbi:ABC transporter ATP-binding protein/permease [Patescibacteria group bacterium]|nr:ABC transporter ATP-binding protein/permease [Patescibacteria group bacterium]
MRNPVTSMIGNTWKYAKGHRGMLILYFLLSVAGNVVILFEPYVFGRILSVIQEGGENLLHQVVVYLIILAALPGGYWMFLGVSRVLEQMTAFRIQGNYDKSAMEALFGLPVEWHRSHHSGKNIDKFQRAGRSLYEFSSDSFMLVQIVVMLIGAFVMLFFVKFYIGIVAALVAVVAFTVVILFDVVLTKQYKKLNTYYNKIAAVAFDYLSNVFTVLTMRFEGSATKEYLRRFYELFALFKKNRILNECKWASVTFLITVMTLGVVAYEIISAVQTGEVILVGTLYTIYAYMDRIGHEFYQFAWRYSDIVRFDAALASAENIFKDYDRLGRKEIAAAPKKWREIKVEGMHFTYEDEKKVKHQIKDINLTIARGEKIAFVGESGCGKSTVLGLLRGIFKASRGKVIVDGALMPKGLYHLAEISTLMPQEPEIFENTIRYNVAMGLSVSSAKIEKYLKLARFYKVLAKLPAGLETNIAEKGVNLSGGEKQRLALARGLLASETSDILLMDEPTSSVDMHNERAIFEGIFREFSDKTVIATVHRLSLLPMFDRVYYFESGRLVRVEG